LLKQVTSDGEVATNTSAESSHIPVGARPIYIGAGLVLLVVVAMGVALRRRSLGVVDIYALAAALVLMAFPGNDARLWIPLVPILIGYAVVAAHAVARASVIRIALILYVLIFAAAGTAALAKSMRLSLSRSQFPDRWAHNTPQLHAAYEVAFGRASRAAVGPIDTVALRLLRYYEPRARTRRGDSRPAKRDAP
jgi:hypothetical protein